MNVKQSLIVSSVILLGLASCKKTGNGNGGGPGTASRFEGFETCDIIAPPSEVELSSYYTKFTNCTGIPVIGNSEVPEEAFDVANQTIDFLLQGLNEVRDNLIERGEYYILVPPGGNPRDVPEFANAPGQVNSGIYWDDPRCGASSAAGLLCMVEDNPDGHANVFVHEMGHMISISGLAEVESGFDQEWTQAYNNAVSSGLWDNTYAQTNKQEYFSVCLQTYYEVGYPFVTEINGDGNWNSIVTRSQFAQYDPTMYAIIDSRFNSSLNVPGCIHGEDYEPWVDPSINCGTTVTDVDGNVYNVVRAGNTCWMAENLKTTRYKDGSPIQNITSESGWSNTASGAWCNYDNNSGNVNTYGRLYNWHAVNNPAGICPDGWHMATQEEWQALMAFANTFGNGTGGALKATELWANDNIGATNETGFTALPSGIRNNDGSFEGQLFHTSFWSSTADGSNSAYSYGMWENGDFTIEASQDATRGQACRCVKD